MQYITEFKNVKGVMNERGSNKRIMYNFMNTLYNEEYIRPNNIYENSNNFHWQVVEL